MLSGLEHRTTYRFSMLVARHMRALGGMYSEKFGLTANTWRVLTVIGRFGPLSGSETGAHTSLEPDKVTRAVDALAKQGYVTRRQDPADRRRVILALSPKGRRVHDEVGEVRDAIEHEFLSVLQPVEVTALYSILDKLEQRASELFSDKTVWRDVVERHVSATRARKRKAA